MTATKSLIDKRRNAARKGSNANYSVRRQEIIAAAALVFREKGYDAATFQDVAIQMKTDRASLYYYFSGKDELLREVVHEAVVENFSVIDEISRSEFPASVKVNRFIHQLMTTFEDRYPHMYIFIAQDLRRSGGGNAGLKEKLDQLSRDVEERFIAILKEGKECGEFKRDFSEQLVANAVFGMINWTYRWFVPGKKYTSENITESFSDLIIGGIAKS